MGRHQKPGLKLTATEIAHAFHGMWAEKFPPVLTVDQAAALAGIPKGTIYDWKSEGKLKDCAHRKGKRLRIFRDRFIRFLFENTE